MVTATFAGHTGPVVDYHDPSAEYHTSPTRPSHSKGGLPSLHTTPLLSSNGSVTGHNGGAMAGGNGGTPISTLKSPTQFFHGASEGVKEAADAYLKAYSGRPTSARTNEANDSTATLHDGDQESSRHQAMPENVEHEGEHSPNQAAPIGRYLPSPVAPQSSAASTNGGVPADHVKSEHPVHSQQQNAYYTHPQAYSTGTNSTVGTPQQQEPLYAMHPEEELRRRQSAPMPPVRSVIGSNGSSPLETQGMYTPAPAPAAAGITQYSHQSRHQQQQWRDDSQGDSLGIHWDEHAQVKPEQSSLGISLDAAANHSAANTPASTAISTMQQPVRDFTTSTPPQVSGGLARGMYDSGQHFSGMQSTNQFDPFSNVDRKGSIPPDDYAWFLRSSHSTPSAQPVTNMPYYGMSQVPRGDIYIRGNAGSHSSQPSMLLSGTQSQGSVVGYDGYGQYTQDLRRWSTDDVYRNGSYGSRHGGHHSDLVHPMVSFTPEEALHPTHTQPNPYTPMPAPNPRKRPAPSSDDSKGGPKRYKCTFEGCGKEFARAHNLKSHSLIHTDTKPYTCDVCHLEFRRNHDLRRHYRLHSGVRPFPCPRCDKRFARSDALRRHLKINACVSKKNEVKQETEERYYGYWSPQVGMFQGGFTGM